MSACICSGSPGDEDFCAARACPEHGIKATDALPLNNVELALAVTAADFIQDEPDRIGKLCKGDLVRLARAARELGPDRVEIERLRADVARLTVTYDNTCSCALADASQPAIKHAKDCRIRVNKIRRLDPGVALDRLATALHSGDEVDELKAEIERLTEARDESTRTIEALAAERDQWKQATGIAHEEGVAAIVSVQAVALAEQDKTIAERDAYRAMVADLLASAHPHPTEHPMMSKQWARAHELLKNGKLNEPEGA